jgi:hypothetical protein
MSLYNKVLIFCLIFGSLLQVAVAQNLTIKIEDSFIVGSVMKTRLRNTFYAFRLLSHHWVTYDFRLLKLKTFIDFKKILNILAATPIRGIKNFKIQK